mgnify:CR=1 FL=1
MKPDGNSCKTQTISNILMTWAGGIWCSMNVFSNRLPSMLLILQAVKLLCTLNIFTWYKKKSNTCSSVPKAQSRHKLARDVWPALYCSHKEPEDIVYQSDPWDQPCRPSEHTCTCIYIVLNSWVLLATVTHKGVFEWYSW